MTKTQLNTSQRKALRSVAHHLDPVVTISDRGVNDGVVEETERALADHELIKVKVVGEDRAERALMANKLAEDTGAIIVQSIGKVAVFYRKNKQANPKLSNINRYIDPKSLP